MEKYIVQGFNVLLEDIFINWIKKKGGQNKKIRSLFFSYVVNIAIKGLF